MKSPRPPLVPVQSTRILRSGFAAGCEAGLRPAATLEKKTKGLGPRFGLWPTRAKPEPGA